MKRYVLFSIIEPVVPRIYKTLQSVKKHMEKDSRLVYKKCDFPEEANRFVENISKSNSILDASKKPPQKKPEP